MTQREHQKSRPRHLEGRFFEVASVFVCQQAPAKAAHGLGQTSTMDGSPWVLSIARLLLRGLMPYPMNPEGSC